MASPLAEVMPGADYSACLKEAGLSGGCENWTSNVSQLILLDFNAHNLEFSQFIHPWTSTYQHLSTRNPLVARCERPPRSSRDTLVPKLWTWTMTWPWMLLPSRRSSARTGHRNGGGWIKSENFRDHLWYLNTYIICIYIYVCIIYICIYICIIYICIYICIIYIYIILYITWFWLIELFQIDWHRGKL